MGVLHVNTTVPGHLKGIITPNMDELICRSLKGRTTSAEEEFLRTWRLQSDTNEAHYRELELLLGEAEAVLEEGPLPPRPSLSALLEREAGAVKPSRHESAWRGRWRRGGLVAAVAAMLALVLVQFPRDAPTPVAGLQAGEFITGAMQTATAVLSDGTVVRLAPDSRLRIPGQAGAREVILEGQAYFAVAELPDQPFRVLTAEGEALVLGTRFELRVKNGELRLIVLEGRVALGASGRTVEVESGEMSLVSDGKTTAPVRVENLELLVEWLQRFVVFQATPLKEVARELERAYGIPVLVTDSLLARETITGWYADRTFEEVLTIVCGVLEARCSIDSRGATIGRHPGGLDDGSLLRLHGGS